jgi:hypothetical protein
VRRGAVWPCTSSPSLTGANFAGVAR